MSTYSNGLQPALQNLLQCVVRFFHLRSSCLTHISADVCGGRKSLVKPVMRQNRVVRFFHPRSTCTTTHISADVQRITINASCMTISGERTDQLDIFCHITGFTSDFLSFIDVEYSVLSRSPSIISRPIALCPPSISSKSRRTRPCFWSLSDCAPRTPGSAWLGASSSNSWSHCRCRGHCRRSLFKSSSKRQGQRRCCSQHCCRSQWWIRIFEPGWGQVPKARGGSRHCKRQGGMGRGGFPETFLNSWS